MRDEEPKRPAGPINDHDRATRWVREDMQWKERWGEWESKRLWRLHHPELARLEEIEREARETNELLRREVGQEAEEIRLLKEETRLLREIVKDLKPRLCSIKLAFGGNMAQGPVILNSGQTTVASVLYFDQQGNPMPSDFTPPAVTFNIDHPEFASSTPAADGQTDDVDFVAAGVANLTASVTSAEGLALSDTETVTCVSTVPPPPQLASIKIDFATPTDIPPAPTSAARRTAAK